MARILLVLGVCLLAAGPVRAGDEVGIAVLEFTSKGGVTQEQMDALGDLLADEIRALGGYRVTGKDDIRALLKLEQKKLLVGCDETGCLAEIGGALGVRWVVLGNVSAFGEVFLLNLKLIDSTRVRVAASVSTKVRGGQESLIDRLGPAVRELMAKARPLTHGDGGLASAGQAPAGAMDAPAVGVSSPSKPLSTWGHAAFWTGLGLAAFGGVAIWQAEEASDDWVATGSSGAASSHKDWNGAAYTAFGLGGALMITGAVLWIMDPGPAAAATVAGGMSPDGRGISLTVCGRW